MHLRIDENSDHPTCNKNNPCSCFSLNFVFLEQKKKTSGLWLLKPNKQHQQSYLPKRLTPDVIKNKDRASGLTKFRSKVNIEDQSSDLGLQDA